MLLRLWLVFFHWTDKIDPSSLKMSTKDHVVYLTHNIYLKQVTYPSKFTNVPRHFFYQLSKQLSAGIYMFMCIYMCYDFLVPCPFYKWRSHISNSVMNKSCLQFCSVVRLGDTLTKLWGEMVICKTCLTEVPEYM